jgi:hypothetical protein
MPPVGWLVVRLGVSVALTVYCEYRLRRILRDIAERERQ